MNILFASELLNGNWAILCIVMTWVGISYLVMERRAHRHEPWSVGSRAALGILVLAVGVGILRASEYASWHIFGELYHQSTMPFRMVGGMVGAIGFLMCIREFSRRLFGDLPWVIAIVLCLCFSIIEIAIS